MRTFGILGFARQPGVGDDARHGLLELLGSAEQRDGVVVALAHLASVEAGQRGHFFLDHHLGQHEQILALAEQMVEALADIARHLHVLDLVTTDRHLLRVEHQDVRRHQHRIAEQAHGHAGIRVFALFDVLVHRRLVGVGTVEQALAGDAGEQPAQLGNLGDVGLAVEGRLVGIQAQRQPGGCDFQARALNARRIIALDQRVVVGEEVEGVHLRVATGNDGRADGASVVAQVRCAGGGDTGKDTGGHDVRLEMAEKAYRRGNSRSFRSVSLP